MPYVIAVDVPRLEEKCFVAFPFKVVRGIDFPITQIIQDAAYQAGLGVYWINRDTLARDIIATIRQEITEAAVLIAVCSPLAEGINPNVMYELGLADALGKPTLVLTTDAKSLPFDISKRGAFSYLEEELTTGPGRKGLCNRLAVALQTLMGRRQRSRVILDDVPGTHALEATNGLVLQPSFWDYGQHVLVYAIAVWNAVAGEMTWLNRLRPEAQALFCREKKEHLMGFIQIWPDYREYYTSKVLAILTEEHLGDIEARLGVLVEAVGITDPAVAECRVRFEDLKRCSKEHDAKYRRAETSVEDVQNRSKRSADLLHDIDPLASSATNLANAANALIRTMVKRICDSFVAKSSTVHAEHPLEVLT